MSTDYLSVVGISAMTGAGVSAFLNYFVTLRVAKKQNQIRVIEEKLDLYSYIVFHLDKMRFKGDALKEHSGDVNSEEVYVYAENELKDTISTVNDKIKD
jgi:hypothetical protein